MESRSRESSTSPLGQTVLWYNNNNNMKKTVEKYSFVAVLEPLCWTEMIPENNMPMRQDVQESLCRSYTKLNRHRESTDIAYRLVRCDS